MAEVNQPGSARQSNTPLLPVHTLLQVANWYPELVEQEAKAKDEAEVVFFVVGPETRAIASMIEVAELISSGRQVVLVLQDVPVDAVINGHVSSGARVGLASCSHAPTVFSLSLLFQTLPPDEVKDLNRGRAYLANVADRHDVTVFQSLDVALQEAYALVQQRRVERAAQFIADDDGAGAASDSDATGPEFSAPPLPHPQQQLQQLQQPEQLQPVAKACPAQASTRPSITSALADLASQFAQDGYGVDDAISEDDDEDRGDDDDEITGVAPASLTCGAPVDDKSGGGSDTAGAGDKGAAT